jgi:isochorismate synthase EntC
MINDLYMESTVESASAFASRSGILVSSDLEHEYAESQAKFLPMRTALENH